MLQDKYGMQKARLSLADDPLTPQAKLGKPTPELNTANTHQIRWVFAEACVHTLHKSYSQYLTLEGHDIIPFCHTITLTARKCIAPCHLQKEADHPSQQAIHRSSPIVRYNTLLQ